VKLPIRPRRTSRGQSLVEMALLLPILLGLAGGATDLARAYSAWLTVESATRNAAEYVATKSCADAACASNTASADAKKVVCTEAQNVPGYVAGSPSCTSPVVTATVTSSPGALGATAANPIVTAQVSTSLAFHTLVPWPLVPNGTLNLSSNRSYSVIYGR
jgi:Flp pilus assembly protein TadG